jgi:hypothetical protein
MFTEVDEVARLTSAVLLRREQATQALDEVRKLVRATELAIQESRRLIAANDVLFRALPGSGTIRLNPLTTSQLENLALLVAKARGGHAFIWNPSKALPVINPTQSAAIH